MNYHWLLILNNLSGISFIEIFSKSKWKESKLLGVYTFLKILIVILVGLLFEFYFKETSNFVKTDYGEQSGASKFSNNILASSIIFNHICGYSIIIIQYFRRRRTIKFFKAIDSFELLEKSKLDLKKKCIMNTFLNVGVLLVGLIISNFLFSEHTNIKRK